MWVCPAARALGGSAAHGRTIGSFNELGAWGECQFLSTPGPSHVRILRHLGRQGRAVFSLQRQVIDIVHILTIEQCEEIADAPRFDAGRKQETKKFW